MIWWLAYQSSVQKAPATPNKVLGSILCLETSYLVRCTAWFFPVSPGKYWKYFSRLNPHSNRFIIITVTLYNIRSWKMSLNYLRVKAKQYCPCWRDFRFSRRRIWRWLSSGLLRRVVWYKFTEVSEMLTASIIRAMTLILSIFQARESTSQDWCHKTPQWNI
jgi:hypothetical protein